MNNKKRILIKLTGKILGSSSGQGLSSEPFKNIVSQIQKLKKTHNIGIVIGGGNILRGEEQGTQLGLSLAVGHQAGMLATIINGLILKNILDNHAIKNNLLSSIVCPQICNPISQIHIDNALKNEEIIIFAGGTGAPFFTTDTNAIVRALQMGAHQVWKGTSIDGVYSDNPAKNKNAQLLKKIKYSDAISQKLGIMDATSLTLAQKHEITIRVFNIFEQDSLIKAEKDQNFGSIIS